MNRQENNKKMHVHNGECENFENRNFENKNYENKGSENKDFEYKNSENKNFEHKNSENKNSEHKNFENKNFENKSFENDGENFGKQTQHNHDEKCKCGENCGCGEECNCNEECDCGDNCNCGDDCNCGEECCCGQDGSKNHDQKCGCNDESGESEGLKAQQYLEMAQRLQADFDNYRKRVAEQLEYQRSEGKRSVIEVFLPCLDTFAEAKKSISDQKVLEGVNMIENKILQALSGLKVEKIEAIGQKFNPHLHNAIAFMQDKNAENEVVLQEYQSGWTMDGRVIRYSKVVVNKL